MDDDDALSALHLQTAKLNLLLSNLLTVGPLPFLPVRHVLCYKGTKGGERLKRNVYTLVIRILTPRYLVAVMGSTPFFFF